MKRLKNGWEISDHSIFFEKKGKTRNGFVFLSMLLYAIRL